MIQANASSSGLFLSLQGRQAFAAGDYVQDPGLCESVFFGKCEYKNCNEGEIEIGTCKGNSFQTICCSTKDPAVSTTGPISSPAPAPAPAPEPAPITPPCDPKITECGPANQSSATTPAGTPATPPTATPAAGTPAETPATSEATCSDSTAQCKDSCDSSTEQKTGMCGPKNGDKLTKYCCKPQAQIKEATAVRVSPYNWVAPQVNLPWSFYGTYLNKDLQSRCLGRGDCTLDDIVAVGAAFANFLMALGAAGMFVSFVYGGAMYLLSFGNSGKVEKGKSAIRTALIGMLIILSAWSIVQYVVTSLGASL